MSIDEYIREALENFNKAILKYRKPKYPIYPTRIPHTSGWQKRRAWK